MKWLLEFLVGDDWRLALGATGALALAAVLVAAGVNAWWLVPPLVVATLWASLRRVR